MKNILSVILLFLFSGYSLSQYQNSGDWRWRNDDGDVYTASWKDSILTPIILNDYENIRLRIELHNYDMDTSNVVLFYTSNRNEWSDSLWSWTRIAVAINNSDTGLFYLSNSDFLEDDKTYIDNKLLPGRNPIYSYQKTVTIESTNELQIAADNQKTVELEYCIRPSTRLKPGSTYYFMLGWRENPFFSISPLSEENFPSVILPPVDWNFQRTGLTSHFNAIFRDKNNTIWIGGFDDDNYKGYILKSTDGGEHWITQWSEYAYEVMDLSFYGDYGWAVVNHEQNYGQTLRTTDGGNTWDLYSNLYEFNEMFWCQFFDENNGYALEGNSGGNKLLKTTDSGKTWQRYSIKDYQYPQKGFFINSDIGWFATGRVDIMKTTDGGLTWVELPNVPLFSDLNAVFFVNENVGWAVGNSGIILKTKDGGDHWILQAYSEEPEKELSNLFFINEKTGWAIGEKGLIKLTRDGGNNWFEIEAPTCNWLNDIYFIDENNGWIIGENAVVLKTSNGGLTFVESTASNLVINNYLLQQNYPNPFNPTTKISYQIPASLNPSQGGTLVTLKVYDILGKEVATLVNQEKTAGTYEVNFSAGGLPSGVYIYKMKAGDFVETKKMILLK
jgi:photosystem II stability/assembly factor-like uncharacterized protein